MARLGQPMQAEEIWKYSHFEELIGAELTEVVVSDDFGQVVLQAQIVAQL
jgi:hypothetical protein